MLRERLVLAACENRQVFTICLPMVWTKGNIEDEFLRLIRILQEHVSQLSLLNT